MDKYIYISKYIYIYIYIYLVYIHTHTQKYTHICIYTYTYAHTYNRILFSHKIELKLAICNDMDGIREYNAKQNKSEEDKYYMISVICRI